MKEELSIDNLDAEIKTNRELYEQLNKITEIDVSKKVFESFLEKTLEKL